MTIDKYTKEKITFGMEYKLSRRYGPEKSFTDSERKKDMLKDSVEYAKQQSKLKVCLLRFSLTSHVELEVGRQDNGDDAVGLLEDILISRL